MKFLRIADDLKLPLDAVTQTFGILAKRGSGKSYAAAVLAEEMLKAGMQVLIIDPLDVFWGLRASADGQQSGLPIIIFGGSHGDLPLESSSGKVLADAVVEHRLSCVLSIRHLSKTAQRTLVADFCEQLYHRKGEDQYREPLHLIIDEADAFVPQRIFSGQERLVGAIDDLVRRGRSSGIGVTLITQRAAVINKDVLTQIETLIALRTVSPQDRKALETWIDAHDVEGHRDAFMASLASLPIGTAWFWSPGWLDIFQRVKVRRRETFDSSATPKLGETVRAPRRLAEVDLEALRERMATTIEKAKADDPRLLRRRITELEKDLRSKPAAAPETKTVIERIEIPVLSDDQVQAVTRAINAVDQLGTELTGIAEGLAQTLQAALSTISHPPPPSANVVAHQRVPGGVERPQPAATERPSRQVPSDAEGLSKGKRTILETLARRHPMVVTLAQLATLARYSPGSGSFQQNLRELRDQGLISRQGREIEITEDGLAALDHVPLPAQTPEELVALWRDALTGGARTIFDLLVEQYPRSLTRDEIAAACNYSPTSGSFQQSLRDLRRNGLAELEGGNYRASPTLFLQEART